MLVSVVILKQELNEICFGLDIHLVSAIIILLHNDVSRIPLSIDEFLIGQSVLSRNTGSRRKDFLFSCSVSGIVITFVGVPCARQTWLHTHLRYNGSKHADTYTLFQNL